MVGEEEVGGRVVKTLALDKLIHSYVDVDDPLFLVYGYEKVLADVATYVEQQDPNLSVVFIGGGGYTMPRFLEVRYPLSTLEVIEIDSEVTEVAFEYMGLWRDTKIVTYNQDARMIVPELQEGQYDLVIGDAFNDFSVPYHLTTLEFNHDVRRLLDDNGIYVVSIVDQMYSGRFLKAYVNTLQRIFPYVYIMLEEALWDDEPNTFVVAGSLAPITLFDLTTANVQAGRAPPVTRIMPEEAFKSWINAQDNILLTDDYVPVDNLLAPLYLKRQ
jgi:spermidine synthase